MRTAALFLLLFAATICVASEYHCSGYLVEFNDLNALNKSDKSGLATVITHDPTQYIHSLAKGDASIRVLFDVVLTGKNSFSLGELRDVYWLSEGPKTELCPNKIGYALKMIDVQQGQMPVGNAQIPVTTFNVNATVSFLQNQKTEKWEIKDLVLMKDKAIIDTVKFLEKGYTYVGRPCFLIKTSDGNFSVLLRIEERP